MARGDHDWEIVASREPFFGLVGGDDFRMSRLDAEARERFYASGERDIARVLSYFDTDIGARPAGRALDFGCGVGRLTRAISGVMDKVVGYDAAPRMIALAHEVVPASVTLTTAFPAGTFDWINSCFVFQHIPPAEGLALIDRCLAMTAPFAFLSLQVTGWREGKQSSRAFDARAARWLKRRMHRRSGASAGARIGIYDYSFSDILQRLARHGFERVALRHTEQGGHHGAWFIARRSS